MSCQRRLDKTFEQAPVLPFSPDTRYVLFSDCHRGNGTHNDNFLKNQHLYFAALKHYYHNGFTYIELGDGDELWENRSMKPIKEIHNDVFWQLSLFYKKNRLYMLYGNHDMIKKYPSFSRKNCSTYPCSTSCCHEPLFPDIHYYAGIILRNEATGSSLYLTHGHQSTLFNSTLWRVNCFLVRYFWKPLEQVGILDPTSAAKNYSTKQRSERRLSEWAKLRHHTLITGHTHRPMLSSGSRYINVGSCVHPRCITCIEVCGETLTLVKWAMGTRDNGNFYVERTVLSESIKIP